jgi:hypothetical protein
MFWKRKDKSGVKSKSAAINISDKAAIWIAGFFLRVQNGFARFMNNRTQQFSARKWKLVIIVFTIGWGTLSIYFIVSAFTKQPVAYKSSRIQFIVKPAGNDSLAILEAIYEQGTKKQRNKK